MNSLDPSISYKASRLSEIEDNLLEVRRNIRLACDMSGRREEEVKLLVVSKYYPFEDVLALSDLGIRDLAENRVQELQTRMTLAEEHQVPIDWHLIGSLQRNKVKYISGKCKLIHSVDSLRLASEISKRAVLNSVEENILLQVNGSKEEQKSGFDEAELFEAFQDILDLPNLKVSGLMTMAAQNASEDLILKTFSDTKELFIRCKNAISSIAADTFIDLSMGMSGDYPLAVRSGATIIRVGSAILKTRTD